MKIIFSEHAWDDYLYWQRTDRKILERINKLIRKCNDHPLRGPASPSPSGMVYPDIGPAA